jgi:transaldolase
MARDDFKIKIYADGADAQGMLDMYNLGIVSGFTTNPTLMKKAGVSDYVAFAKDIARQITDLPLSFEVFSDDFAAMEEEARIISSWGKNVYVKIPVTNTKGESSADLVRKLSNDGVHLNVTALLTLHQVREVTAALAPGVGAYVSVFAGRIADTGVDPVAIMAEAAKLCHAVDGVELLWASTREVLNIFQAQGCGVDIITVTNDILKKLPLVGKDLAELSLETVQMFYHDAVSLGYSIHNRGLD